MTMMIPFQRPVEFRLSNGNRLHLYFPERDVCYLIPDAQGIPVTSPSTFRKLYNCPIGFVPIVGPVEHNERLFQREAARLALFSYTAARNFQNIWYHFPERFEEFRATLQEPGLAWTLIRLKSTTHTESYNVHMFCPEDRIPRELFLGRVRIPGLVPDAYPSDSVSRRRSLLDR